MEQLRQYRIFDLNLLYVIVYLLLCVVTATTVIFFDNVLGFGEAEDFLLVLIFPLFYSIFHYNRCSFYVLFAMALATSAVVLYFNDYNFFKSSMNTVLIYSAIIAVSREVIAALLTKQWEAEREIERREQNYREIFNGVTEAFFVHDAETGRLIDVNESTCKLFGYTKDEILNLSVGELSSENADFTQEKALELIQQSAMGNPQFFKWQSKRKNGELFWTEVNLRRVSLGDGDRVLAVAREITDRKKAEEERNRLIDDLQNALREINELKEILPICSHCKKVRNDQGYWEQVENYIHTHYNTHLSHSICPDCVEKHYSEYLED